VTASATEADDRAFAGKVIAVPETRQLDTLAALFERRGAEVIRCPLVGIQDSPDEASVMGWIARFVDSPPALLVLYTGEGLERLLGFARRAQLEPAFTKALERTAKLTRGPKPQRALRRLGLRAEHEAQEPTTDGLIAAARELGHVAGRVAIQLFSADQDRRLVEHFAQHAIETDCVAPYVYASAADDDAVQALVEALEAGRIDAITFTSQAQVERIHRLAADRDLVNALRVGLERTCVAAIGPVVRAALEERHVRVDVMPSDHYSMKPLVTALAQALAT